MKFIKNLQTWLILLAFLITLGILFGGETLATKYRINDPLKKEVGAISGVGGFKLEQAKNGVVIDLKLRKVDDLQDVLDQVKQKVQSFQDKPVLGFQIQDHPNHLWKLSHYQLSFYLEEAAVSGRYIQLKNALDSFRGITARAYLSHDFIYLQMEDGGHYLYQAIPRTAPPDPTNNNGGGETG